MTVNTVGYGGKRVDKTIKVYTNDTRTYVSLLTIGGRVKSFATFSRRHVVFKGEAGNPLRKTITITQNEEFPFNVKGVRAKNGEFIRYKLRRLSSRAPHKYELWVENTRDTVGNFSDTVFIDTDSKVHKQIAIRVIGRLHGKKK